VQKATGYTLDAIAALTKLLEEEGTAPELLLECQQMVYRRPETDIAETDTIFDRLLQVLPFAKSQAAINSVRPPLAIKRLLKK
jgi:hypothetical protein